jgi:signal transduction histidine kinase
MKIKREEQTNPCVNFKSPFKLPGSWSVLKKESSRSQADSAQVLIDGSWPDNLTSMLVQVQEAERARIARELHVDLNQQLAVLSLSLSQIKNKVLESKSITVTDITALQEKVHEIANDIRSISHGLHPGIISRTGLEAVVRHDCSEFSDRSGVDIQLVATGDINSVPAEIALCVYRVFQESLHNIRTHAHAKKVKVCLIRTQNHLELIVEDNGQGFDQREAKSRGGLGLLSMDERVRLIRGHIKIQTHPFSGTKVRLQIPI